ncbi:Dyp-type peroxidase [Saccharothrix variisporea]|uniref:Secreted protein n=1 Tax=Saccharothrix variisporea TaxID=543527 RepID=A0A495XNH4_9PSEU|nr:Dyp-type peroxidase [Saccharothrix variisporea]RKT74446.1 secreted protein [Saccharothrix variisporea]
MAITRRALLAAAGAASAAACTTPPVGPPRLSRPVVHQRGIVEPERRHTVLAAFDVVGDLEQVLHSLRGLAPAGDVVLSVGASLFDARPGLARPSLLTTMPAFPGDVLDPTDCGGDVLAQLSSDDPSALPSAFDVPGARLRWTVEGQHTGRNAFGFREGTGNPDAWNPDLMDQLVWVQPGDPEPEWCVGGTYLAVRLIRLAMPTWDSKSTADQELVFGRHKESGAPLGSTGEQDALDYVNDPEGTRIPLNAHIRRANPRTPESQAHRILRRGYTYRRPADAAGEHIGHIFTCYQRDLERGFATTQRRLAGEALAAYLLPFGGGYYFVLPGDNTAPGER